MKVRLAVKGDGYDIDEVIAADNLEGLISKMRDRVARDMGWRGLLLKTLSPLEFAHEIVKRFNEVYAKNQPMPQSLEEFLEFAQATGKLKVIER